MDKLMVFLGLRRVNRMVNARVREASGMWKTLNEKKD